MSLEVGVVFAFLAMLGWGFGDFFIQKSIRKLGNWETLFVITLFGAIILTPFVYENIYEIFSFQSNNILILLLASAILLFAALLDFEALKQGKLAVVEPIWSLEIPISALLAFFITKEIISGSQIILILSLVLGLILVSLKSYHFEKRIWLEKGTVIAVVAAIIMGSANFFIGAGSRATDPITMNWFLNVFIALVSFIFLLSQKKVSKLIKDIKSNKKLLLTLSILDNFAWIAFAFSLVLTPIAIAVALSESYIIIAVLLGMYINKEKIKIHQKVGLTIALISAIILAYIS